MTAQQSSFLQYERRSATAARTAARGHSQLPTRDDGHGTSAQHFRVPASSPCPRMSTLSRPHPGCRSRSRPLPMICNYACDKSRIGGRPLAVNETKDRLAEPGNDHWRVYPQVRNGGQGRGRTDDLPLFRRTLVPTELPDRVWPRAPRGSERPEAATERS